MSGVQEISAAQKILDGKELVAVPENQDWLGWIGDIAVNRDHWLSYAFRGFQILNQKGVQVNHFVSIGTGSGIDAIGALEIFRPQTVTVTDLAPAILSRAKENIIRYQQNGGSQARINFGLGSLCEPLGDEPADLIYTNLPNLPVPPELKNKLMENGVSAAYFDPDTVSGIPNKFSQPLLSLQYAFLLQAKKYLSNNGRVLLNLGVRMPVKTVEELFTAAGYSMEAPTYGVKLQTRAAQSIGSYAAFEKEGIVFTYYPYVAAIEVFNRDKPQSLEIMFSLLEPFKLSAVQAIERAEAGEQIGYPAALFCGRQSS